MENIEVGTWPHHPLRVLVPIAISRIWASYFCYFTIFRETKVLVSFFNSTLHIVRGRGLVVFRSWACSWLSKKFRTLKQGTAQICKEVREDARGSFLNMKCISIQLSIAKRKKCIHIKPLGPFVQQEMWRIQLSTKASLANNLNTATMHARSLLV